MKLWLLPLVAVFAVAACSQETKEKVALEGITETGIPITKKV